MGSKASRLSPSAARLGPAGSPRSIAPAPFLPVLMKAGRVVGVTRLADLTGLDRIGFPVWQAVRPAGRAQSVHQGKGATNLDARIGALGEALESHYAEQVEADGPVCAWQRLPPHERAEDPSDFLRDRRSTFPEGPIAWCRAGDLLTSRTFYLPHLLVSLDCTLPAPSPFDRTSNGLAAGTTESEAVRSALLELLERDAVGTWERLPAEQRVRCRLALHSVRIDWFDHWRGRIAAAGCDLRLFALEAVEGTPVCIAYVGGRDTFGTGHRTFVGSGADGDPELALFKALAEALQSRLTFIAGARDDMLPSLYTDAAPSMLLGRAVPPGPRRQFGDLRQVAGELSAIAARLAARGYGTIAVKRLDGGGEIPVVKAFVPGLGSLSRVRRTP